MSCPSQSSWLDHPNDIWRGVQSIKLFVMQSSPLPWNQNRKLVPYSEELSIYLVSSPMALCDRLHQDILFRSVKCDESTLVRLLCDKSSTSVSRSPLNWFRRRSFNWLPWRSRVLSFRSTWKTSGGRSSSNPLVRCNLSRRAGRSPELKAFAGSARNLCPSIRRVVMLPSTCSSRTVSQVICYRVLSVTTSLLQLIRTYLERQSRELLELGAHDVELLQRSVHSQECVFFDVLQGRVFHQQYS
jgi:hypothetical protein